MRLLFISISIILFLISNSFADTEYDKSQLQYEKGMYVVITGAGSGPLTFQRGGASVAVVIDGKVLQFDTAPGTRDHLFLAGILPEYKIDYLFFTHLHADHTSDFVNMNAWPDDTFKQGYKIFGPASTRSMTKAASDFITVHDYDTQAMVTKAPSMADIVKASQNLLKLDVVELSSSGGVILDHEGLKVTATSVPHMMAKDGHSYAYRVDSHYGSVVISGDTAPSLNVVELAKDVDILVHEVTHHEPWMKPEMYRSWQQVKLGDSVKDYKINNQLGHSSPAEVGKVAQRAGAKKLVTYHTPQFTSVRSEQKRLLNYGYKKDQIDLEMKSEFIFSIKKNYDGPVVMGEPLMVFEIGIEPKNTTLRKRLLMAE